MPYAAKMVGYSDIHLYQSVSGGIRCNKCELDLHQATKRLYYYEDVLEHLEMHVNAGHKVPAIVFTKIQEESAGKAPRWITNRPAPEPEPEPEVVIKKEVCPDPHCLIPTIHTGPHEYGALL